MCSVLRLLAHFTSMPVTTLQSAWILLLLDSIISIITISNSENNNKPIFIVSVASSDCFMSILLLLYYERNQEYTVIIIICTAPVVTMQCFAMVPNSRAQAWYLGWCRPKAEGLSPAAAASCD